jgi:hypothetical protein
MKKTVRTYYTKDPSSSYQLMGAYDQFSNKHKRKPRPQGAQTDNAVFAADKAGEDTLLCKLRTIRSLQYTAKNEGASENPI